jgi:hypothetical protein
LRRMNFSTMFSTLVILLAPLVTSSALAHADEINWNLLYGGPANLGGALSLNAPPPVYVIVPAQPDTPNVGSPPRHHRVYRHHIHWQVRDAHHHWRPRHYGAYPNQ